MSPSTVLLVNSDPQKKNLLHPKSISQIECYFCSYYSSRASNGGYGKVPKDFTNILLSMSRRHSLILGSAALENTLDGRDVFTAISSEVLIIFIIIILLSLNV